MKDPSQTAGTYTSGCCAASLQQSVFGLAATRALPEFFEVEKAAIARDLFPTMWVPALFTYLDIKVL